MKLEVSAHRLTMNYLETIGFIHVLFYVVVGVFTIARAVYLTIRNKKETQEVFKFGGLNGSRN